jgi:hypothetical protein
LVHPLTETRRPALTHTSARATPEGCIVANSSGTAVNASAAMAMVAHGRFLGLIEISLTLRAFPPTGVCGNYIRARCDEAPLSRHAGQAHTGDGSPLYA